MGARQTFADVLARRVERRGPDDCWLWTGATVQGYGQVSSGRARQYAHHVALVIALGRPLADGRMACHTCDVKACCNPAHLYEGTAQDNSDDAVIRGRTSRGRRRPDSRMRVLRRAHGDDAVWLDPGDYEALALSPREAIERFVERVHRGDGIDSNTRWLDGVA